MRPKQPRIKSGAAHPLIQGAHIRGRTLAAEMVALVPDVVLAPRSVTVGPLLQATRILPLSLYIIATR
jgi:hypothetical protein